MSGSLGGLAKYEPRFTRPENEETGESIHWFKVAVNDKLVVPISVALVGNAKDLFEVFGFRMPERFLKANGLGMVVSFENEIPNGEWPYQKCLITQQSLIYDLVDIMVESKGIKMQVKSQARGQRLHLKSYITLTNSVLRNQSQLKSVIRTWQEVGPSMSERRSVV